MKRNGCSFIAKQKTKRLDDTSDAHESVEIYSYNDTKQQQRKLTSYLVVRTVRSNLNLFIYSACIAIGHKATEFSEIRAWPKW